MALMINQISYSGAKTDENIQSLPCRIEYDGKAKVDDYFSVGVREEVSSQTSEKELRASLRGRPLHGKKFELPATYTGVVLKESRKPFNDEEDREVKASHKFKEFTYWNLDLTPSEHDKLPQALQWIDLANVLHSSIEPEEEKS